MSDGQIVLVTTEQMGGGPPMRMVFYVAEEDPAKAEALVAAIMALNEAVEARDGFLKPPLRRLD
jgi:hypothetical protein